MSNKYFSKNTRLLSKGIIVSTIVPPGGLNIPAGNNISVLPIDLTIVNQQSIPNINSVGLFCNFADGLVPASPSLPIHLTYAIRAFDFGVIKAGTLVPNVSYNVIDGMGTSFIADLSIDDYVLVLGTRNTDPADFGQFIVKVKTVISDTKFTIYGYNGFTVVNGSPFRKLTLLRSIYKDEITQVNVLNEMFPCSNGAFRDIYTSLPPLNYYCVEACVTLPNPSGYIFYTKSIDVSYVGSNCYFDYAMDFEYTFS